MTWSAYSIANNGGGFSPPILGPDGDMWTASQATSSYANGTIIRVTPSGSVAVGNMPLGFDSGYGQSPVITDGTDMYVTMTDTYPRNWAYQWSTSLTQIATVQMSYDAIGGLVYVGAMYGSTYVGAIATGATFGGALLAQIMNVGTLSAGISSSSGSGFLGFSVYDGAWVWAASGTSIYQIYPPTLTMTSWTLPGTYTGGQAQIGRNGSLIYIPCTTGVVVWDTSTATGTLHSSAQMWNCFYSANLGKVIVSDNAGNVYTMPASGGSLTLLVNLMSVTGTTSLLQSWFGDGLAGSLWVANASLPGSGEPSFIFKYTLSTNNIVMLL